MLLQESPGGAATRVSLVVPTIVQASEPFELKLAVLDEHGYPCADFDGSVKLRGPFASPGEVEVPFRRGGPAVARLGPVAVTQEGLYRFQAELDGRAFPGNPLRCLRSPGRRIYWGDPHVHTVLSNCHPDRCRSLEFCYVAARHLTGLDWVAPADHVSNGRGDPGKWKAQCVACDLYDEPPIFATVLGYEASLKGGAGGDNNVYLLGRPEMFVDEYEQGNVRTLCEKLARAVGPGEFFVVPHHTTRTGKHGEIPDEIYPGSQLMPVVEIHSKWGTSEYRGNPNPLHQVHPGPSYAADLLGRGLKLGFIAGTDTHATMPGGLGQEPGHIDRLPGLTAVWAEGLSPRAVFRAIQGRDCYAASGERIYLEARIAGARPGQTLERPGAEPRRISVSAAAESEIRAIEIVRNGRGVLWHQPPSWQGSVEFADEDALAGLWLESSHLGRFVYYYARVTCASGAQAWSSPVWLVRG